MTEPALSVSADDFLTDPAGVYARLRAGAPVRRVRGDDGAEFWMITRCEHARAALLDTRLSSDPVHLGHGLDAESRLPLLHSDPPEHTRLRRIVARLLTRERAERLRPAIERVAGELVSALPAHGVADLITGLAFPLPLRVLGLVFGLAESDLPAFQTWAGRILGVHGDPVPEQSRRVRTFFAHLVAARRAGAERGAPDLLTGLMFAPGTQNALTDDEIVALCAALFAAGTETMVNLIGNGVVTLLRDRAQFDALRDDPAGLPAAVEEILRYEGSASQAAVRLTPTDLTLAGVAIPAGDVVRIGLAGANRDPGSFQDADELDLARSPNPHLAFGHGPHYCLGASLARVQAQVAFGTLIRLRPRLSLARAPERLEWRTAGLLKRPSSVPVLIGDEAP